MKMLLAMQTISMGLVVPILAVVAGILVLVKPSLTPTVVGIWLLVAGLLEMFGQ